jgi:hypothetical protein
MDPTDATVADVGVAATVTTVETFLAAEGFLNCSFFCSGVSLTKVSADNRISAFFCLPARVLTPPAISSPAPCRSPRLRVRSRLRDRTVDNAHFIVRV